VLAGQFNASIDRSEEFFIPGADWRRGWLDILRAIGEDMQ
jgi:hypothetical protein